MFGFLKNFAFNPGGIVGAIVSLLGLGLVLYALYFREGRFPPGGAKLFMLAAVGGGLFGNWIWKLAFGSGSWEPPTKFEIHDDRKVSQ